MTTSSILIGAGGLAVVALFVVLSLWSRSQALAALRSWAQAERLELISATRRSLVPLWRSGKGYQFFRVTVRAQGGGIRRAWVRCLDFNSAEPHNIEVTWDEKSSA